MNEREMIFLFRKIALFNLAAVMLLLGGCTATETGAKKSVPEVTAPPVTGNFEISFLKTGQADAFILQTENHNLILDCGEIDDGAEVIKNLEENGISSVDYMFITHFDKDHVGGTPEILDKVDVKRIITPDYEGTNDEYEVYEEKIREMSMTPEVVKEYMSFTVDDVLFEVYPPKKKFYAEGDNDFSLIIAITHGENRFLFAGDAEEERLLEFIPEIKSEYKFLKYPHHGRCNEMTGKFINRVSPEYVVITDSEKNPAEKKTVSILENAKCEIYYTRDGDIEVVSDGTALNITQ